MFRGPTAFVIAIIVLLAAVIGYRYHQYVLTDTFLLATTAPCDPAAESCFVWDCSPEEDGDECDVTPYKKVEVRADRAPQCLLEHTCEAFSCDDEELCAVTYCSEDTAEDYEVCAVPPAALPEEESGEEPQ